MAYNKNQINFLLSKYPKKRPPLSEDHRKIYESEYILNREGQSFMSFLSQKLESWMHITVNKYIKGDRLLEVGAGTLNHFKYFHKDNLKCYDVIEPFTSLYDNSVYKKNVNNFYKDISECKNKYDSIFSIAALEHIEKLPELLARSGKLLNKDGIMISAIPCEGGVLWGASWRCSTGLSYKIRTGLSYKDVMRYEHINCYSEIITLIKYFFEDVNIIFFPIYGKHFSLYACIISKSPRMESCNNYLKHLI